jgi:1-deoxy-D-xylulose-5-phosphate synthase
MDAAGLCGLAAEIRETIIEWYRKNGGHLPVPRRGRADAGAPPRVQHAQTDRIIWDVGHQSYAHKIITGRAGVFASLRKSVGSAAFRRYRNRLSNRTTPGTAVRAFRSRWRGVDEDLRTRNKDHPVIGDGSMTGGMAFEALNQIAI